MPAKRANANPHQSGSLTKATAGEHTKNLARTGGVGLSSVGNGSRLSQRTPISRVRRVWGILKNTTTAAVKSALKKLSPTSADNITILKM